MRVKRLLSILGLTAFGLTAIAQVASAGAAKDQFTGDIYVTGFSPRMSFKADYSGQTVVKSSTANSCGIVTARVGWSNFGGMDNQTIQFSNQTPITFGSIPTVVYDARPKCAGDTAVNVPSGGVAKYISNNITYVAWTGKTPFQQYDILRPNSIRTRSVSSNACGVVRLSNQDPYKNPSSSIQVYNNGWTEETAFNPSTIPSVTAPPVCKNNTLLLPPGFPN